MNHFYLRVVVYIKEKGTNTCPAPSGSHATRQDPSWRELSERSLPGRKRIKTNELQLAVEAGLDHLADARACERSSAVCELEQASGHLPAHRFNPKGAKIRYQIIGIIPFACEVLPQR